MSQKYQLKNGMNVVLIESHKSPVVAVQMWVKTGSADENKGIEGISHFIEHLVFKGSEKFKVGEIASAVEGAGGVLNAYTTFDQTVFYVTVSKAFADTGLEVISEMMGRPAFDSSEIDNEREVVIEEIKRSFDNPHQQASRLLFSTVYKAHPYGLPVIGFDDNIRRVSREEIVKYYRSRYVPQNMNLVIVGDFKTKEMKAKVEGYFGGFKKYKLHTVKRAQEAKRKEQRISIKEAPINESFLYISWPTVNSKHEDAVALSVIAIILGQGDSSRLTKKIRNDLHLVSGIGTSVFQPKDKGFFALSTSLNKEKLEPTLAAIREELLAFISSGPTVSELQKAIRNLESEKYYSMETVDGLAGLYGHFEFLHNDYNYFDKVLKQIAKLTPEKLRKVAQKYLEPADMKVSFLTNENKEVAQKKITQWVKQLGQERVVKLKKAKSVKAKSTKVKNILPIKLGKSVKGSFAEKIMLENNVRFLAKEMKDSPLVSLRIGFLGGQRAENESNYGVNELTTRVWPTSTQSMNEEQLNNAVEGMASGIGAFGGRNSVGLSMTALVSNAEKTFDILSDILLSAQLDEQIVSREKKQMHEYIKTRTDKPSQQCILNFMSLMFEDHPYGRDPYGGESQVEKLQRQTIKNYLSNVVSSSNVVISMAGNINMKKWDKKLSNLIRQMNSQKTKDLKHQLQKLSQNKRNFVFSEKEQTHIALGFRGLKLDDPRRYTLEVMQSILSGQGGRLFIELRDKESLAYSVSPIRLDGLDGGYFGAYIGCSPEKSDKAVQMMRAEFQKLMDQKVGEEELARAKRYLHGRHDIALQRTGHICDLMLFDEMYGLDFNEYERFNEHLNSVDAEKVQSLAREIFTQNSVLSVVGKKDVSK